MLLKIGTEVNRDANRTYIGVVEDNLDPKKCGRVRVRVAEIHGTKIPTTDLPWAMPLRRSLDGAAASLSEFHVPENDTQVTVFFDRDDLYSPVYAGAPTAAPHVHPDFHVNYPNRYGSVDFSGNKIVVDKKDQTIEIVHSSQTRIFISKDGSVEITVQKDDTEEVQGNRSVTVRGTDTLTVEGDATINVQGDLTSTIEGNSNSTVNGSASLDVSGDVSLIAQSVDATIKGDLTSIVQGSATANVTGSLDVRAGGNTSVVSQGETTVQANGVNVTSQGPINVSSTGSLAVSAAKVTVSSGKLEFGQGIVQPAVLGDALSAWISQELTVWLSTHTHVSGSPGAATTPPLVPFQPGSAAPRGPIYSIQTNLG